MANFLEKLLAVVWWGLLLLTITLIFFPGARNSSIIYMIITVAIYLFAIYKLRKIIKTVAIRKPFIKQNVIDFRQIGYAIFLIGIVDTILTFPSLEGALLIGTPYGGIKPRVLIYIIFGCFALILAEVFSQALEIKKENELTI